MELIKELYETDIGNTYANFDIKYRIRKASRAIVINDLGQIALLHVSKSHYHKLPGGGIELGEDTYAALQREMMEEVGVHLDVLGEVGTIIEYRNKYELLQISYCFYGKARGNPKRPSFTALELNEGFQPIWVGVDEAISLLQNDDPDDYGSKFIRVRDLTFLQKAKDILQN
jgi:8-oxo-dGTP diphosphatase